MGIGRGERMLLEERLGRGGPSLDKGFLGLHAIEVHSASKLAERDDGQDGKIRDLWARLLGLLPLSLITSMLLVMSESRVKLYIHWAAAHPDSLLYAKFHALLAAVEEWSASLEAGLRPADEAGPGPRARPKNDDKP